MSSSNYASVLAAKLTTLPTRTSNQDKLLAACQWPDLPRHALALYDLELHTRGSLGLDLGAPIDWSQATFNTTSSVGTTVSVAPNWSNIFAFLEELMTLLGPLLMIFLSPNPEAK
jgi:hypothetical protein